ncbi:MAG TPA: DUF6152 family protein [Gammaproteobacteria bacterium]
MTTKAAALLTALGAFIATVPAAAHHSFSAEFDANSPIELTGVVTKVEWMNPHTFFYIDVEGENGEYQNWALELGSPNGLMRRGWTRDSLKVGDVVTVTGSRARDGSFKGNARSVVLANGKRLFNGQNEDS